MPATVLKGDLFNTKGVRAYAHGCNCAGAMDAGVSVAFKKRWPRMFDEYVLRCGDGRFHLGDVFVWTEGDETVYNLALQEHWKTRTKVAALARSVEKMVALAEAAGVERIGLPRIATGLGGLDWPRVRNLLVKRGEATKVELLVFEQFVRAPADAD